MNHLPQLILERKALHILQSHGPTSTLAFVVQWVGGQALPMHTVSKESYACFILNYALI